MGNPLSPILSNLYMEFFEKILMRGLWNENWVWYRYVDDCFIVVPEDFDVEGFLLRLNSLSPSIDFTSDVEENGMLPFLDVCIIRGENGFPKFKIHRKITNKENYIHCFSSHSVSVKKGVITGLFLRALRLCSLCYLKEEFDHLREVFDKLGYEKRIIEYAILKAKATFYNVNDKEPFNIKNTLVVPLGVGRNIRKFVPDEVKLVNSSGISIKSLVKRGREGRCNSGIYCIGCLDCTNVYLGETGDFGRRLYQQDYAERTNNRSYAIVKHKLELEHSVKPYEKNNLFYVIDNEKKRVMLESFAIRNSQNFSNVEVTYDLDCMTNSFIGLTHSGVSVLDKLEKVKAAWCDPGG